MTKRFWVLLTLIFCLLATSPAIASCLPTMAVPFGCTAGDTPALGDNVLGGPNSGFQVGQTVKWTWGQVFGAGFPVTTNSLNLTSAQGIQFGGVNGLFVTSGNAWQQGTFMGPRAGAYVQANNLPIAFGMVAMGVAALENLTNQGAEAACGGAFSCQYATTASAITGWGEHVIGFDNSNDMTAGGNDSMRDTIGCLDCTAWGSSSQGDGTGNTNTSLGAFSLWGNAGSITVTGSPTIGDTYHIAFTTTNASVVGLPATASFTATTTNANDLAAGLTAAIVGLNSTVTYLLPSGRTTWTDSGVGLGAFSSLNNIKLHFPGSQAMGWQITPTPSCTGTCTATLTVGAGFTGTDNIAIGSHSLQGLALTSGSNNISIGDGSLSSLSGASSGVVCVGLLCGASAVTGNNSIVLGIRGAWLATVLTNDAIINSGNALTTGIDNTFINSAGNVTSGSGNIEIGSTAAVPSNTGNWQMSIANVIYGTNTINGASGAQIGVNQPAPGAVFDILGSNTSSGTLAFRVQNITPANLFSVADDGTIKVGATAGVSCSGTPTSSFASVNGIVTHC